ncbi:hypothetical protein IAU60_006627 [Kwoniella sp. DSM 27419]
MTLTTDALAQAGPSTTTALLIPGPSPFHESSQFRHWRYSLSDLANIRQQLNAKSVDMVRRNTELEKEAQVSLGHSYTEPPQAATYLTVDDELLLLRFYCSHISKICRDGFGLPEVVESTAISYLKRFYLKNSVMEWHPKNVMPTCLFLAAKTTNYPVLMDQFTPRFSKLTPADILDTEFVVAQSLGFEFWVRGAEKALRGWGLDMQNQPSPPLEEIAKALPTALAKLSRSLLTDLELVYTPSQIALACWHMANSTLVEDFLDTRYAAAETSVAPSPEGMDDGDDDSHPAEDKGKDGNRTLYGMHQERLLEIIRDVQVIIRQAVDVDLKKVKEVDKRLRQCSNPEKVPGTALYVKRKREKEAAEASQKAAKHAKAATAAADRESVFGSVLTTPSVTNGMTGSPTNKIEGDNARKPLSPRLTVNGVAVSDGVTRPGGAEVKLEGVGMGIAGESGGMILGGQGLKDVGLSLEEED